MSMKNNNDTIGNGIRDLPSCSAVPQPTATPHVPKFLLFTSFKFRRKKLKKLNPCKQNHLLQKLRVRMVGRSTNLLQTFQSARKSACINANPNGEVSLKLYIDDLYENMARKFNLVKLGNILGLLLEVLSMFYFACEINSS